MEEKERKKAEDGLDMGENIIADPMIKYQDLKEEVTNVAHILLEENPKNKGVVFKILDDIQKEADIEIPHELDVEFWEDDSITFSDGLILLKIAKQDDKFVSTIEGCWFGAKDEEPFQLPIPKQTESYENQFNAIAQTIIQRGDILNRYYLPKLNIKNNEELSKNPNFREWKKIMFGIGLCGLDFIDVHNALKSIKVELKKITGKTIDEIKEKLSLDYDLVCCIIGVELPQGMDHNEVTSIGEAICEKLNSDANVMWQGVNKDVDEISVYLMKGKK